MKRLLLLLFIITTASAFTVLRSQTGGNSVYQVLNLPPSARSAALGGMIVSAWDSDPALVYHNPALANQQMNNHLSLNYANYLAGIQYGYLAYSRDLGKWGTPVIGFQYLNYGKFTEANEYGDILGTFTAAEYTLNISYAYRLDSVLTIGATIRPIYSVLERYTSFGLSSDSGIHYHSPNSRFDASLVARNLGSQLTTYATPERETLPFEVLAGMNYKLKYAPFRLHITTRNLQVFNLRPASDILPDTAGFFDQAGRLVRNSLDHVAAGVEFCPGNLLAIRIGYSFLRRAELKLNEYGGATGFSFGAGVNLGWMWIDYALASYNAAAMTHTLSIRANLDFNKT
ncbi:MAG: type IX secretion system protein PorQ [Bacteroidota bacterium]